MYITFEDDKSMVDTPTEEKRKQLKPLTPRQLDVEIAKRVMGREVAWSAVFYGDWMDRSTGRPDVRVRRYSADIAAAMEVVAKLGAQGYSFACTIYQGRLPYASFCKGTAASSKNAEADTLPEAICRAALALVDGNQSHE